MLTCFNTRVGESETSILEDPRSRYHFTLGEGFPRASHGSRTVSPTAFL